MAAYEHSFGTDRSHSQQEQLDGYCAVLDPLRIFTTQEHHQDIQQIEWQQYEIPYELRLVQPSSSQEIYSVIRESLNSAKAIRSSILDAGLHKDLNLIGATQYIEGNRGHTLQNVTVSRSSHVSYGSGDSSESITSLASPGPSSRWSAAQQSLDSATTCNSSTSLAAENSAAQEAPSEGIISQAVSTKLGRERDKSPKSHGLRRLFRGNGLKAKGRVAKARQVTPSVALPSPVAATTECASCFDDISKDGAIGLACQHYYCSPCFLQLVNTAIQHENFFPPKCCLQEIPKKTMRNHLSANELAQYNEKAKEYAVPAEDRWYCSSGTCGKLFDKGKSGTTYDTISCPHCKYRMCKLCRGPRHPLGGRCPQDRGLDATLEEAKREGWRQCYKCRTMVELTRGCRHVTCKCRAEFCYTCGARWRTCSCTEEDEVNRRNVLRTQRGESNRQEAALRAEEEEVRTAIAAVEAAMAQDRRREEEQLEQDRQERRKVEDARIAEEALLIERMETARREGIASHFDRLRDALEKLHVLQRQEIKKRHEAERQNIAERDQLAMKNAETEHELISQMSNAKLKDDERLQETRRRHARDIVETLARHRADQSNYLQKLQHCLNGKPGEEIQIATMLEELAMAQEEERKTSRKQQTLELQRLQKWAAEPAIPAAFLRIKEQLKEEKEDISRANSELARLIFAESKWFDMIVSMQKSLVDEDERRRVASGADAPCPPLNTKTGLRRNARVSSKIVDRGRPSPVGIRERTP